MSQQTTPVSKLAAEVITAFGAQRKPKTLDEFRYHDRTFETKLSGGGRFKNLVLFASFAVYPSKSKKPDDMQDAFRSFVEKDSARRCDEECLLS